MQKGVLKYLVLPLFTLLPLAASADRGILLVNDRDALQARVDLIQQAKSEVLVEYFSVWNDDQSIGGMALLIDAAQQGRKVKIIVDALSNTIPRSLFATLLEKGKDAEGNQNLEILEYNPIGINLLNITRRDHAKMLIADGTRLISGGRNVGDKYFGLNKKKNFNDLDVFIEGDVARQARENFFKVWNSKQVKKVQLFEFAPEKLDALACAYSQDLNCDMKRLNNLKAIENEHLRLKKTLAEMIQIESDDLVKYGSGKDWLSGAQDTISAKFVSQNPEKFNGKENNDLTDLLAETLSKAEVEANIVSPYLIPTKGLIKILKSIIARGVKVRIITNSLASTDNLFAQAGYRAAKQELIEMGLEIYEYNGPDTVHAKTAVIDNKVAMVGTYNIDPRSAFLNREVATFMEDSNNGKIVNEVSEAIEGFRAKSFLVGKDGVEYNKEKEYENVSGKKRKALKLVQLILPLIKSQL